MAQSQVGRLVTGGGEGRGGMVWTIRSCVSIALPERRCKPTPDC